MKADLRNLLKVNMKVDTWFDVRGVLRTMLEVSHDPLWKAGFEVRRIARDSMKKPRRRGKPSEPGRPPHIQSGRLKRSIRVVRDAGEVLVVSAFYGRFHEFGSKKHPKRPFLMPALEEARKEFPGYWRNAKLRSTRAGRAMESRNLARERQAKARAA